MPFFVQLPIYVIKTIWVTIINVFILIPFNILNFFVLGIKFKRKRGKHSSFLSWSERVVFLNRFNKGIRLAENKYLSLEDSFKNLLVEAPVGSGKSSAFVVPNLLELRHSALVTDMGEEIYKLTSGYLAKQGFNIKVLNFGDPKDSLRFNPLLFIRNDIQRVQEFADMLVNMKERSENDSFWNTNASTVINCILLSLVRHGDDRFLHLKQAYQILLQIEDEVVQRFLFSKLPDEQCHELKGILTSDSKLLSNILSLTKTVLRFASDQIVSELTSGNDFSLDELRNEKTIIYVICPLSRFNYFKPVISLFYNDLFNQLLEKEDTGNQPIHFFLDEFGNLFFPNFPTVIASLRKRKCSLNLIIQEEAQLRAKYGQEIDTIRSNCLTRMILSGSAKQAKEVSEQLGTMRGEDGSIESLITPEQIRTMDSEEALCVFGNLPAIKLKFKPHFHSLKYKRRVNIPPAELDYNYDENAQAQLIDFDRWEAMWRVRNQQLRTDTKKSKKKAKQSKK